MRAVKGNRVYTVDETSKDKYVNDGFDIVDDDGKVIETGKGKTVSYEDYQKLVDELEALKAEKGEDGTPGDGTYEGAEEKKNKPKK